MKLPESIYEITPTEVEEIIETREPRSIFYATENGKYIGIDNSNGKAWVEEFDDLETCLRWLNGEMEVGT